MSLNFSFMHHLVAGQQTGSSQSLYFLFIVLYHVDYTYFVSFVDFLYGCTFTSYLNGKMNILNYPTQKMMLNEY